MKKFFQDKAPYLICAFLTCLMIRWIIMSSIPEIPSKFTIGHTAGYDFRIELDHKGYIR